MIDFVKSNIVALRTIALGGALSYLLLVAVWFTVQWRDHLSHSLGFLFFAGSLPWSLPWVAYEAQFRWLIPASLAHIPTAIVVAFGFGLNLAIAAAVTGYLVRLLRTKRRGWRKAHDV